MNGEYIRSNNNDDDMLIACKKDIIRLYSTTHNADCWIEDELNMKVLSCMMRLNNETIAIKHKKFIPTIEEIQDFNNPGALISTYNNMQGNYKINIWHTSSSFTKVKKIDDNYNDLVKASTLLKLENKQFVRIYKTSEQIVHIFTSKYNWEISRRIIAIIPKLFPELELEELKPILIKLGSNNTDEALNDINEIFNELGTYTNFMKDKFNDLKEALGKKQMKEYEDSNEIIRKKIASLEQEMFRNYQLIDNNNAKLFLLATNNYDYIDEYYDYTTKNKRIRKLDVINTSLHLTIDAPLKYFNSDDMRNYIRKNTEFIYRDNLIKLLMEKLFITNELELYTTTYAIMNLKIYNVNAATDYEKLENDYLLHPHLMTFNCWGNNKPEIIKAIKDGDLIGATEQIIASTYNINLLDTTVLRNLINNINENKFKKVFRVKSTNEFISLMQLREVFENEAN